MSHVFISYSRKDSNLRDDIVAYIKEWGHVPWYDEHGIEGGDIWPDSIDAHIEEAYAFIVVCSENAAESDYVKYEWAFALGQGVDVFPISFGPPKDKLMDHPKFDSINVIDVTEPERIKGLRDSISLCKDKSFLVRYTEGELVRILTPTRVCIGYTELIAQLQSRWGFQFETVFWQKLLGEANKCMKQLCENDLPDFWLHSAHAVTKRQKRMFEDDFKLIELVSRLLRDAWISIQALEHDSNLAGYVAKFQDDFKSLMSAWSQLEVRLKSYHSNLQHYPVFRRTLDEVLYIGRQISLDDLYQRYGVMATLTTEMTSSELRDLISQVRNMIAMRFD
ncbi:MAG: toll/interleukin-1 receptor domain-containing protein [Anaerolineae bacterium]|nr:toll/interleukin-1 receptor domain-containing protein [Anaerolineae bacterium]